MPNPVEMPVSFVEAADKYSRSPISMGDLRREFGVSLHTVKKWLAELGVSEKSARDVMSSQRIGKPSGGKGLKRSAETCAKISAIAKARKPTTLGFKFSEGSKEKMRVSAKIRVATTDAMQKMREGREKNYLTAQERIARKKARDACKRMLRRVLTMARIRKDATSEQLLGYTKNDLRVHLERQFRDGMGWEVRNSFHIDHIKPVAQFFREGIYDPSVINALGNLQVLTPSENMVKADKFHISFSHAPRMQALVIDHDGTRTYTA